MHSDSFLPALFVENQGQWADELVRFVPHSGNTELATTGAGPVL